MSRLAERIARLREEVARQVEVEIVPPAWASVPIGAKPSEAAPAPEGPPTVVIDATDARKLTTPRRKRQR